jgi:hypothetical protein
MGQNQSITLYPTVDTFVSYSPYGTPVYSQVGGGPGYFPFPAAGLYEIGAGTGSAPQGPGTAIANTNGVPSDGNIMSLIFSSANTTVDTQYIAFPSSRLHHSGTLGFNSFRVGGFNAGSQLSSTPSDIPSEIPDARQIRGFQVYSTFGYLSSGLAGGQEPIPLSMTSGTWAPAGIKFTMVGPHYPGTPYPLAMPWDVVATTQVADVSTTPPNLSTAGYYGAVKTSWLNVYQQIQEIVDLTGSFFSYHGTANGVVPTGNIPVQFSDISSVQIGFEAGWYAGPVPEIDIKKLGLIVYYNDAPEIILSISDQYDATSDNSFVNSDTPTLSWSYTDPEFDPQASFIVAVLRYSDTQDSSFPSYWGSASAGSAGPNAKPNPIPTIVYLPTLYAEYIPNNTTGNGFNPATTALSGNAASAKGPIWNPQSQAGGLYSWNNAPVAIRRAIRNNQNTLNNLTYYPALVTDQFPEVSTNYPVLVHSGQVLSNANQWQIPPGTLHNGEKLVAYVMASDTGSNGRYSAILPSLASQPTNPNTGLIFTPLVEPILMPEIAMPLSDVTVSAETPGTVIDVPDASFSPALGSIGPIEVRNRMNILYQQDADFTGGTGNWAPVSGFAYDTLSTTTLGNVNCIQVTGTTPFALTSGSSNVTPGDILTASIWYESNTSSTPGFYIGVAFWDADGNTSSFVGPTQFGGTGPTTVLTNAIFSPKSWTAQESLWAKAWMQTRVPPGAAYCALVLYVANSSQTMHFGQAAITNNTLNLVDDPSFDNSLGTSVYWTTNSFSGFSRPNLKSLDTTPTSYPSTLQLELFSDSSADPSQLTSSILFDLQDAAGTANYLVSYDARANTTIPANTYTLFPFTDSSIPNPELTTAYQRIAGDIAWGTGSGSTLNSFMFQNTVSNSMMNVDNFFIQRVWELPSIPSVSVGTAIPNLSLLGDRPSSSPVWGQNWTAGNSTSNAEFNQTTLGFPLSIFNLVETPSSNNSDYIESLFTVSGGSTLTLGFTWGGYNTTMEAFVEFYTPGNSLINPSLYPATFVPVSGPYTGNIPTDIPGCFYTYAASNSYYHIDVATEWSFPVPTNAAYARVAFLNTGPPDQTFSIMQIGYITTSLSNPLAPAVPWMDGGWSAGGLQQSSTPGVGLQRSSDGINWTGVRFAPNAAVGYNATNVADGFGLSFTDYEYPSSDYGVGETVYYRAQGLYPQSSDVVSTPVSQTLTFSSVSAGTSLAPTNWLLIDPRYPDDNISLSVKKATFTQAENQSVLQPVGRGRKVVVGDTQIFGDTITLDLLTVSNEDFRSLQAQYEKVYPLLLRSPDGEMWYVRLTQRSRERVWQGRYTIPYRTYSITMEQVDATP